MDWTLSHFLGVGAILMFAATLQSAVGFGFGLLAVPSMMFLGLTAPEAIAVAGFTSSIQAGVAVYKLRKAIPWRMMAPRLAVGLIGLIPGLWLLDQMNAMGQTVAKQIIGAVVLAAVITQALLRIKPRDEMHAGWGYGALFAGGILSGSAGMGGPPIVLWAFAHHWNNDRLRGILLLCFPTLMLPQLAYMAYRYDTVGPTILKSAAYVPLMFASTIVGLRIGKPFSRQVLRRTAYVLLSVTGLAGLTNPWWSPLIGHAAQKPHAANSATNSDAESHIDTLGAMPKTDVPPSPPANGDGNTPAPDRRSDTAPASPPGLVSPNE